MGWVLSCGVVGDGIFFWKMGDGEEGGITFFFFFRGVYCGGLFGCSFLETGGGFMAGARMDAM